MDEAEKPRIEELSQANIAAALRSPAVFATRVFLVSTENVMRLSFGESLSDDSETTVHTSVATERHVAEQLLIMLQTNMGVRGDAAGDK